MINAFKLHQLFFHHKRTVIIELGFHFCCSFQFKALLFSQFFAQIINMKFHTTLLSPIVYIGEIQNAIHYAIQNGFETGLKISS